MGGLPRRIRRFSGGGARQFFGMLRLGRTHTVFQAVPVDLAGLGEGGNLLPEFTVLDGLLVFGAPALGGPGFYPVFGALGRIV